MKDETERAEILDRCLERIRWGEDPDRVLGEHPDVAAEIRPLLGLAEELGSLPDPSPSVEGLVTSVARLAAASEGVAPVRKPRFFSSRVWLRVAAALLVILVGGWGTVTASAEAVPGDFLYPVKRFTERVRFFLTVSDEGKAELRLVFSGERLRESVAKLRDGEGIDENLLREMLEEARMALDGLEALPPSSRNLLAMRTAHLSDYQRETLDGLQKDLPREQQKVLVVYRDACGRRASWAREIVSESVLSPEKQMSPSRIRRWREGCPDWGGSCR